MSKQQKEKASKQHGLKDYVIMKQPKCLLSFSIGDILTLPFFKHMNRFELMQKENDQAVKESLFPIGVDDNMPLEIQACQHYDLNENLVIDWRYIFTERTDSSWAADKRCSSAALAASQNDVTMADEISTMSKQGIGADGFYSMCMWAIDDEGGVYWKSRTGDNSLEEQDDVKRKICELQAIQENIRGVLGYNENIFNKGN